MRTNIFLLILVITSVGRISVLSIVIFFRFGENISFSTFFLLFFTVIGRNIFQSSVDMLEILEVKKARLLMKIKTHSKIQMRDLTGS